VPPVSSGVGFVRSLPLTWGIAMVAAGVGCGAVSTEPRAQLITLFDLVPAADSGGTVAAGTSLPAGFPATKFVAPGAASGQPDWLRTGHGFIDGQPATWVTTELWLNFNQVWAQPLYRAMKGGQLLDDPNVAAPWVFAVGPDSSLYSPFWEVYGFEVPDDVDVSTVLDVRSVLDLANRTGGLTSFGARFTSLAPDDVVNSPDAADTAYYADDGAWDGAGNHRYIDFGPDQFTYNEKNDVVRETPFFIFVNRGAGGAFQSAGFLGVGGTHALFSSAPSLTGAGGAAGGSSASSVIIEPSFGGLWRIYLVETFNPTAQADGRVLDCLPSGGCLTLDGQSAIEALGAERIHRTEILTATPLLTLGDRQFSNSAADLVAPSAP
jgi:hypothetical protein